MVENHAGLRLYIDSVDSQDWADYLPTGLFYGVTTNPKLLAGKGCDFEVNKLAALAESAFDLGVQEIHLQVWGSSDQDLLAVGRELGQIDDRVSVKVPITPAGIRCASQLKNEGIRVTLTALHAAEQALIAAALGADYAAPYLGRMNDGGLNGLEEIIRMGQILNNLQSPVRLLIASIRQIEELVILAEKGLTTFTLLPALIEELLENELTRLAADSFQEAVMDSNITDAN